MASQYEGVLLKLTQTEDDKFSQVCEKLLPIVMREFLWTKDKAVLQKLVEIQNHMLQRVRANEKLYLPIAPLIELCWDDQKISWSPNWVLFRNLSIIFLSLWVERKQPTVPNPANELLSKFHKFPKNLHPTLFLTILNAFSLPD